MLRLDVLAVLVGFATPVACPCGKPNKGHACLVAAGTMAFSEVV